MLRKPFEELSGHVDPVHTGVNVMYDVVPIVEGVQVLDVIDAVEREDVVVGGSHWVDKNVLRPIPKHEGERRDDEGYDCREPGSSRVALVHEIHAAHPHTVRDDSIDT